MGFTRNAHRCYMSLLWSFMYKTSSADHALQTASITKLQIPIIKTYKMEDNRGQDARVMQYSLTNNIFFGYMLTNEQRVWAGVLHVALNIWTERLLVHCNLDRYGTHGLTLPTSGDRYPSLGVDSRPNLSTTSLSTRSTRPTTPSRFSKVKKVLSCTFVQLSQFKKILIL